MAHCLQAVVGPLGNLELLAERLAVNALGVGFGLALLPLPRDAVGEQLRDPEFAWPDLEEASSASLAEELNGLLSWLRAELRQPEGCALLLTEYWAGTGAQVAALLDPTAEIWVESGAVNRALCSLGVAARPGADPWAAIGLDRWRSVDTLLDAQER